MYVDEKISEDEYVSQAVRWWDVIDSTYGIRNFQDRPALLARVAISLLSARTDHADQLGEKLSWFLEVLGFLGIDTSESLRKMDEYFGSPPS